MLFYIGLRQLSTTSGLLGTGNTRKYHQIPVENIIFLLDDLSFLEKSNIISWRIVDLKLIDLNHLHCDTSKKKS